jgi:hypothetical protein
LRLYSAFPSIFDSGKRIEQSVIVITQLTVAGTALVFNQIPFFISSKRNLTTKLTLLMDDSQSMF